ncbi:MAG: hypothetical protein CL916_07515 [Deltaproteobacteria bacterium]|nr:hypothetical protein [Deltaproteobacteria bacterium]
MWLLRIGNKYNHLFTPEINSNLQFGFQRGFSVGFSPLEQGPLLSTSYTSLTRMQIGVGRKRFFCWIWLSFWVQ